MYQAIGTNKCIANQSQCTIDSTSSFILYSDMNESGQFHWTEKEDNFINLMYTKSELFTLCN